MDPFLTANLKAFVAQRPTHKLMPTSFQTAGDRPPRSSSVPPGATATTMALCKAGTAEQMGKSPDYEKILLLEQRRKRGQMMFLERMEADANSKHALQEVIVARQDPGRRQLLDRTVQRLRPVPTLKGPVVASHDRRTLWEGHDRKLNWAPLEYY
mmetsp:Transcript_62913/g.132804  ORF Transcript_62913/g.132804 Transcript_62913/m.132804 type:complete len:155 (-) Transcript_62913:188-652(-)